MPITAIQTFPLEFSDLLSDDARKLLTGPREAKRRASGNTFFVLRAGLMATSTARSCVELLDRHLYPLLRRISRPIPPDSITAMTRNYGEVLPKALRMKTCHLHSRRCVGYRTARNINLLPMLESASLRAFAETVTGLKLERNACQVVCYEHGDYAGPHNDHHPESHDARVGFVDVHIMLSNEAVDHHWLVYEEAGHLCQIRDVNLESGVAVYRLPFWHYTTPLMAKPGREGEARRWLLLVTYDIVQP